MSSVSKVWIDPYILQVGEFFFKTYSPKPLCLQAAQIGISTE